MAPVQLSPESGIQCQIICGIQLLTTDNLGGTQRPEDVSVRQTFEALAHQDVTVYVMALYKSNRHLLLTLRDPNF